MGSSQKKIAENHLEGVYDDTLEYLGSLEKSNDLFSRLENLSQIGNNEIVPPEAYRLLKRLKRFNLWLWDGAYSSQPYLAMLEFESVMNAEIAHENLKAKNAELKARHEAKNGRL